MRVLVCGGRSYSDRDRLFKAIDYYFARIVAGSGKGRPVIIHGGARGADSLADAWACAAMVDREIYPANWTRDGKAAGPIRNRRMLTEGRPDVVLAFPGGKGTSDMVRQARAAGVNVIQFPD